MFPIGCACFIVINRGPFEHLPGYDEAYFLCSEDLNLGMRAVAASAAPAVVPVHPTIHHSAGSFATPADARAAYLRGRARYQGQWWSTCRAVIAGAIRTSEVLARLAILWMIGSDRVHEFTRVWALREEWTTGRPLRRRSCRGVRSV
jgi:hypothetical protein